MKEHHAALARRDTIEPELPVLVRFGNRVGPHHGHPGIGQRRGGSAIEDGTDNAPVPGLQPNSEHHGNGGPASNTPWQDDRVLAKQSCIGWNSVLILC